MKKKRIFGVLVLFLTVCDLELKKFKPAVGVEIGEDELFSDDIKDITDLVEELVAEREGKKASK